MHTGKCDKYVSYVIKMSFTYTSNAYYIFAIWAIVPNLKISIYLRNFEE